MTGGIGSGKSSAAKFFSNLGITVIDADKIAYEITRKNTPAYHRIVHHFGDNILTEHGDIDRSKIRDLIFNSAKELEWLEGLLHPMIIKEIAQRCHAIEAPYCVLMIPLLTESSSSMDLIDRVLVIDAPESLQITRTKERDNVPEQKITAIMQAQLPRQERLMLADDIIVNDSSLSELEKAVSELHTQYLAIAQSGSSYRTH